MTTLTWPRFHIRPWHLAQKAAAWWLRELHGLIPNAVKQRWARQSASNMCLHYQPGRAFLSIQNKSASPHIIPLSIDRPEQIELAPSIATGASVEIRLDDAFLFRPVLELPLAAEASLQAIIRHQLDRLVPLDPETLCFAWHIIERSAHHNRLRVVVCITKRAVLDQAIGFAGNMGLKPHAVVAGNGTFPDFNIWRAPAKALTRSRERMIRFGLDYATLTCVIIAYTAFLGNLDGRVTQLQHQIARLRSSHVGVQALSARTITAEQHLHEIYQRLKQPRPLSVIDALSRSLPPDCSLLEFHLQRNKVEIVGTAHHATGLIAIIDASKVFEKPVFLSPIVAGGVPGTEHFEMSFQLREDPPA